MQIILDVKNDSFIERLREFISGFENVSIIDSLDIAPADREDIQIIEDTKAKNNKKYSLDEARKLLDDSYN